jgi:hypothetical protein
MHRAAFDAGFSEKRDRAAEAYWDADAWVAFDAGRDAYHENYLRSIGTSSVENRAARGKD